VLVIAIDSSCFIAVGGNGSGKSNILYGKYFVV
jgi:chromosome segregation ATPase